MTKQELKKRLNNLYHFADGCYMSSADEYDSAWYKVKEEVEELIKELEGDEE